MPDTVNYLFFAYSALWALIVFYLFKLRAEVNKFQKSNEDGL